MSYLPTRMKTIQAKMKVLECSQLFSHCKYMMIFSDAQGKLTLQSEVGSGRNSNSSKLLWLSSLHARMKNERARVATLYIIFSDAQGQITPKLVLGSGGNLNSFKLSCMFSLPANVSVK